MTDFAQAREAMVDCQVRPSDVTRYSLIDAMLHLPREGFVPRARHDVAYAELEVPLGDGRFMLAPRVLAKMIEAAEIEADDLVLVAGSAEGYAVAVAARMAQAAIGVEADETLLRSSEAALAQAGVDNAAVLAGEPAAGDTKHGPFDVILVNGGAEAVPDALLGQLRDGGRLVAIVQDAEAGVGACITYYRRGDALSQRRMFDATAPMLDGFGKPRGFEF